MKQMLKIAAVALVTISSGVNAGEYSTVPVSVDELKAAVDLDVKKYLLEFDEVGTITLEIKGPHTSNSYKLDVPSKSATLTLYYEPGPDSAGSSIEGWETLHFWIGAKNHETYSYLDFKRADAVFTKTGFTDGVFQVVASLAKGQPEKVEYSLRVTSTK